MIANWSTISDGLSEPPRKRMLQIERYFGKNK